MFADAPVFDCDMLMPKQPLNGEVVEFGAVLDQLLKERGWNQSQLSAETDPEVSQGQISNYRYGRRKPKARTIEIIAQALALTQDDSENSSMQYRRILDQLRHAAGLRSESQPKITAPDTPPSSKYTVLWSSDDLSRYSEDTQRVIRKAIETYADTLIAGLNSDVPEEEQLDLRSEHARAENNSAAPDASAETVSNNLYDKV